MAYIPSAVARPSFARLERRRLDELARLPSVTATASDVLDELGWSLAVPSDLLAPRTPAAGTVAGHVVTLQYLPERAVPAPDVPVRLAHEAAFAVAEPGDVIVVSVPDAVRVSAFGGMAARVAVEQGIAACVVDGGVRDVEEIRASGLAVWSRYVTPRTGKRRLEAVAINDPISCGSVQVRPGDLLLADGTGVCFVPNELCATIADRMLEIERREAAELASLGRGS